MDRLPVNVWLHTVHCWEGGFGGGLAGRMERSETTSLVADPGRWGQWGQVGPDPPSLTTDRL